MSPHPWSSLFKTEVPDSSGFSHREVAPILSSLWLSFSIQFSAMSKVPLLQHGYKRFLGASMSDPGAGLRNCNPNCVGH